MDVIDRVEHLMGQRGMKRSELMRRLGKERSLYDTWKENGIPAKHYAAIAQALNTTIGFLCGEAEAPEALPLPGKPMPPGAVPGGMAQGPYGQGPLPPGGYPLPPMPPFPQQRQAIERIVQALQGLDQEGLSLVEGFIALYRSHRGR